MQGQREGTAETITRDGRVQEKKRDTAENKERKEIQLIK